PYDTSSNGAYIGASWVFTRSDGAWTQQGSNLVGSGAIGPFVYQGWSVALAGDGNTIAVGGPYDNPSCPSDVCVGGIGAAWVFVKATPTNTHDFNDDGMSDIAWRDTSGDVAIWEMNGTSILNPTTSYVGTVSPGTWSIVGQRDFNGDGYADLLWHDTSGDVAIWEMNGTTILNPTATYVATVSTAWSIVGTGDFNGTGMGDILWRDTS